MGCGHGVYAYHVCGDLVYCLHIHSADHSPCLKWEREQFVEFLGANEVLDTRHRILEEMKKNR